MSVGTEVALLAPPPSPQSRDEQYLYFFVGESNGEMQAERPAALGSVNDRWRSYGAILLFSMVDESPTEAGSALLVAALDKIEAVDTVGLARFLHTEMSRPTTSMARKKVSAINKLSGVLRRQIGDVITDGQESSAAGECFADRVDQLGCLLLGVQKDDLVEAYRRLETLGNYDDDLYSHAALLQRFLCTLVRRYLEIDWGDAMPAELRHSIFP